MINNFIATKIASKLSKFIHNINKSQLEIAILSGTVRLDNVLLKVDQIQNLLNFKIEKIEVKHLRLKIPLNFLYNPPELLCQGVYVFLSSNLELTKDFLVHDKLEMIEEEIGKMIGKKNDFGILVRKFLKSSLKIEDLNVIYCYKDTEEKDLREVCDIFCESNDDEEGIKSEVAENEVEAKDKTDSDASVVDESEKVAKADENIVETKEENDARVADESKKATKADENKVETKEENEVNSEYLESELVENSDRNDVKNKDANIVKGEAISNMDIVSNFNVTTDLKCDSISNVENIPKEAINTKYDYRINMNSQNFVLRINKISCFEAAKNRKEEIKGEFVLCKNLVATDIKLFYIYRNIKERLIREKNIKCDFQVTLNSANTKENDFIFDVQTRNLVMNIRKSIFAKLTKITEAYWKIKEIREAVKDDIFFDDIKAEKITIKKFCELLNLRKEQNRPDEESIERYKKIMIQKNEGKMELCDEDKNYKRDFEFKHSKEDILKIRREILASLNPVTRRFWFWRSTSENTVLTEEMIKAENPKKFRIIVKNTKVNINLVKKKNNISFNVLNTVFTVDEAKKEFKGLINYFNAKKNGKICINSIIKKDFLEVRYEKNRLAIFLDHLKVYKLEYFLYAITKHFKIALQKENSIFDKIAVIDASKECDLHESEHITPNKTKTVHEENHDNNYIAVNNPTGKTLPFECNIKLKNVVYLVEKTTRTNFQCDLFTILHKGKRTFCKIENFSCTKNKNKEILSPVYASFECIEENKLKTIDASINCINFNFALIMRVMQKLKRKYDYITNKCKKTSSGNEWNNKEPRNKDINNKNSIDNNNVEAIVQATQIENESYSCSDSQFPQNNDPNTVDKDLDLHKAYHNDNLKKTADPTNLDLDSDIKGATSATENREKKDESVSRIKPLIDSKAERLSPGYVINLVCESITEPDLNLKALQSSFTYKSDECKFSLQTVEFLGINANNILVTIIKNCVFLEEIKIEADLSIFKVQKVKDLLALLQEFTSYKQEKAAMINTENKDVTNCINFNSAEIYLELKDIDSIYTISISSIQNRNINDIKIRFDETFLSVESIYIGSKSIKVYKVKGHKKESTIKTILNTFLMLQNQGILPLSESKRTFEAKIIINDINVKDDNATNYSELYLKCKTCTINIFLESIECSFDAFIFEKIRKFNKVNGNIKLVKKEGLLSGFSGLSGQIDSEFYRTFIFIIINVFDIIGIVIDHMFIPSESAMMIDWIINANLMLHNYLNNEYLLFLNGECKLKGLTNNKFEEQDKNRAFLMPKELTNKPASNNANVRNTNDNKGYVSNDSVTGFRLKGDKSIDNASKEDAHEAGNLPLSSDNASEDEGKDILTHSRDEYTHGHAFFSEKYNIIPSHNEDTYSHAEDAAKDAKLGPKNAACELLCEMVSFDNILNSKHKRFLDFSIYIEEFTNFDETFILSARNIKIDILKHFFGCAIKISIESVNIFTEIYKLLMIKHNFLTPNLNFNNQGTAQDILLSLSIEKIHALNFVLTNFHLHKDKLSFDISKFYNVSFEQIFGTMKSAIQNADKVKESQNGIKENYNVIEEGINDDFSVCENINKESKDNKITGSIESINVNDIKKIINEDIVGLDEKGYYKLICDKLEIYNTLKKKGKCSIIFSSEIDRSIFDIILSKLFLVNVNDYGVLQDLVNIFFEQNEYFKANSIFYDNKINIFKISGVNLSFQVYSKTKVTVGEFNVSNLKNVKTDVRKNSNASIDALNNIILTPTDDFVANSSANANTPANNYETFQGSGNAFIEVLNQKCVEPFKFKILYFNKELKVHIPKLCRALITKSMISEEYYKKTTFKNYTGINCSIKCNKKVYKQNTVFDLESNDYFTIIFDDVENEKRFYLRTETFVIDIEERKSDLMDTARDKGDINGNGSKKGEENNIDDEARDKRGVGVNYSTGFAGVDKTIDKIGFGVDDNNRVGRECSTNVVTMRSVVIEIDVRSDEIFINVMDDVILKNYTKEELTIFFNDDLICIDELNLLAFKNNTYFNKRRVDLSIKLGIKEWKSCPNEFLINSKNTVTKESEFSVKKEKSYYFLFFKGEDYKVINVDFIIARKDNRKVFYVFFYPDFYIYNSTNYSFDFIARNDTLRIDKRVVLASLTSVKRSATSSVTRSATSSAISVMDTASNSPSCFTNLTTSNTNSQSAYTTNLTTTDHTLCESIDEYFYCDNIISLNMSKKSDILKLVYKNEKELFDCVYLSSSNKKESDNVIIIGENERFKLKYNYKTRKIHGIIYKTDICEVVIYPYFIVKNYLLREVYLGNIKIKKGENNMYFENKRVKFIYNKNFKSKNEMNLYSYEIFNIIKLKNKEREGNLGEIYTKSHIFGKKCKKEIKVHGKASFNAESVFRDDESVTNSTIVFKPCDTNDSIESVVRGTKDIAHDTIDTSCSESVISSTIGSKICDMSSNMNESKTCGIQNESKSYTCDSITRTYYYYSSEPIYKNIAIEMIYGTGKYSDTKILSMKYANLLHNNTNYKFFIVCEGEVLIVEPGKCVYLHFGKFEGFYIYFNDEYGFESYKERCKESEASVGEVSADKVSVGKASVDKASVGKASVGKASADKASVGKAGVDKAGVDKAGVGSSNKAYSKHDTTNDHQTTKYTKKHHNNNTKSCAVFCVNDEMYKINNSSEHYLREFGVYVSVKGISPINFHLVRNERVLFRLQIKLEGKQRKFEIKESFDWPFIVYNKTKFMINLRQKEAMKNYILFPNKKYNYCFDEPSLPKRIEIDTGKVKIELFDELNDEKEIIKKNLKINIFVVGDKKMIELCDKNEEVKKINNFKFECKIEFLSVSIFDKEEILCLHFKKLILDILKYTENKEEKILTEFKIKGMQIDDQNIFSKCPVIIYPKNKIMNVLHKNDKKDTKYFIKVMIELRNNHYNFDEDEEVDVIKSIRKMINNNTAVVMPQKQSNNDTECKDDKTAEEVVVKADNETQESNTHEETAETTLGTYNRSVNTPMNTSAVPMIVNFCSFLVQPFFMHIDQNTLAKIMHFMEKDMKKNFVLQCDICERIKCECKNEKIKKTRNIKINTLHIHPIIIQLTFKKGESSGFYDKLLKYIVENISDFNIVFNAALITEIENPIESILDLLISDYKSQIYSQLLKVLVSVDLLGNIGSLADSFSIGVKDLFYEPYLGLKEDDPKKFSMGLLKGGTSFIKNTVTGVTGTIGKFTSSLSKGIGLATFDKKFQNYTPMYQNKYLEELGINIKINDKSFDSANPLHSGLRRFKTSICSGVSGIFNKPVEGAKEGFAGFIKGVGKGTMGLVTKPIVGIADLAGSITERIKKELDDNTIYRIQFPRRNDNEIYNSIQNMCYFIYKRYIREESTMFLCGMADSGLYLIVTNLEVHVLVGKEFIKIPINFWIINENCIEYNGYKIECTDEVIETLKKEMAIRGE